MKEIIRLPYSVYSHPRRKELTYLIHDMGYMTAKMYSGDKHEPPISPFIEAEPDS